MTWRGELAGYTATLILEEVDEDERRARHRFQGTRDGTTATATLTVTAAGEITAEVHPGHGSDLTAEALAAAAREVWPRGEAPAAGEGLAPQGGRRRALVAAGAAAALAGWALKGRR